MLLGVDFGSLEPLQGVRNNFEISLPMEIANASKKSLRIMLEGDGRSWNYILIHNPKS